MSGPLDGIVGGGIGGLSAAIALRTFGFDVVVVEQAPRFARAGADINLTPNAVRDPLPRSVRLPRAGRRPGRPRGLRVRTAAAHGAHAGRLARQRLAAGRWNR